MTQSELVTVVELEKLGIVKKGTAYRMAKAGKLPCYSMGSKGRGIRFKVGEVLAALRRPALSETETTHFAHLKKGVQSEGKRIS